MRILILGLFCVFTFLGNFALAAYPEKAIRIIVPYKAGGGTDSIARGFVSAFSKAAGVDVVITNVNGGAGSKGIIQVMKSKPDGYNLVLTGSTDIIGLSTFRKMPFKSIGSLTPVGGVYTTPTYVLAHKDRGYKTLEEVIEKSKANPGKLIAGIGGKFGAHDVLANAVNGYKNAGFRIVAFDGGAMLKKATIANEVDICIIHSPVLLNEVKAGLLNYSNHLAQTEGANGVRSNVICPGPIYIDGGPWNYIKDNMADFYNATLKNIPLGKFGAGEDIAKSVVFLASPASAHTTGTNVVIDGGFTKGVQF